MPSPFCAPADAATRGSSETPSAPGCATRWRHLKAGQEWLGSLLPARERAREQCWELSPRVTEAEAAFNKAEAAEPSRLAQAYANGEPGGSPGSLTPVAAAQAALDTARESYRQVELIGAALDSELGTASSRLQQAQTEVYAALAAFVCGSAAFPQLFVELTQAWARLRGVRKAFAAIQHELHGYMPDEFAGRWGAIVSLNHEAAGLPTDENPVEAWTAAITRLLDGDPDAELPDHV